MVRNGPLVEYDMQDHVRWACHMLQYSRNHASNNVSCMTVDCSGVETDLLLSKVLSSSNLVGKRAAWCAWWATDTTHSSLSCFVDSSLGKADPWH